MRTLGILRRGGLGSTAALVLLSGLAACADDDGVDAVGPPSPEPVAEAQFFTDPGSYVDERVTVVGEVDTILHNDAFTMVPRIDAIAANAKTKVLVVHPGDLDVAVGSPVEVTGTPQSTFDPPQVEPFREVFAEDPAFRPFIGDPYLEADAVDRVPGEEGLDPADAP